MENINIICKRIVFSESDIVLMSKDPNLHQMASRAVRTIRAIPYIEYYKYIRIYAEFDDRLDPGNYHLIFSPTCSKELNRLLHDAGLL